MSNLKPIRDPVHNYILTTPIEISIIDSPDFQRLRFILQNSSAYLTYPGSTNNRFLHSIGVMHLSGLFFVNALRNTDSNTLIDYLKIADELLKHYADEMQFPTEDYIQQWNDCLGNISQFSHEPSCNDRVEFICDSKTNSYKLKSNGTILNINHDPFYIINTLWQALRLAALIHDIGHLPMSHVFEHAIVDLQKHNDIKIKDALTQEVAKRVSQYEKKISYDLLRGNEFKKVFKVSSSQIHELRSLNIFEQYRPQSKDKSAIYKALVYKIAKDIFLLRSEVHEPNEISESNDYFKTLRCLHGIVSGELDADRLDYCLRDSKLSGLEYGAIDSRRIIDNILLYKIGEKFFILPTDKSLSAIESFFHQRYAIYQYFIYHHNVVRNDGVLKEIVVRLIEQGYKASDSSLSELLHRFNFVKKAEGEGEGEGEGEDSITENFRLLPEENSHIFDDAWLRTLFAEVLYLLKKSPPSSSWNWKRYLILLIETFLYRRTDNLFSIWKRPTDFKKTYTHVATKLNKEPIDVIKKGLLSLPKMASTKKVLLEDTMKEVRNEIEKKYKVIMIYRYLEPKIFSFEDSTKNLKILISNQETKNWEPANIDDASPYIKSLLETTLNTPNQHISFVGDSIKNKPDLIRNCKQIVEDGLSDYYKKAWDLP